MHLIQFSGTFTLRTRHFFCKNLYRTPPLPPFLILRRDATAALGTELSVVGAKGVDCPGQTAPCAGVRGGDRRAVDADIAVLVGLEVSAASGGAAVSAEVVFAAHRFMALAAAAFVV